MMEAVRLAFQNYVNFQGRARPAHFWYFVLFAFICMIVLGMVEAALGLSTGSSYAVREGYSASAGFNSNAGPLTGLFALAILLPYLALAVRRLHDTDRSGWWLLIGIIPLIGGIVLLVFFILSGTRGTNRFGPDPLEAQSLADIFGS